MWLEMQEEKKQWCFFLRFAEESDHVYCPSSVSTHAGKAILEFYNH